MPTIILLPVFVIVLGSIFMCTVVQNLFIYLFIHVFKINYYFFSGYSFTVLNVIIGFHLLIKWFV